MEFLNAARSIGVKGIVTNKQGKSVNDVTIRIEGNSKNVKVSSNGEYWRLLLPGVYRIRVEKLTMEDYIDPRRANSVGILSKFETIKVEPGTVTRHDIRIN